MKMKKLSEEHYIIVDDSEIKEGDWYYLPRTHSVYQCKEDATELNLERDFGVSKVTHSTQPESLGMGWMQSVLPLLLSEVKELFGVVDVEKKGEKKYPKSEFWVGSNPSRLYDENAKERRCYIEGYNQALEDNKEKKYTEEDLRKAISETRRGMLFLDKYVNEFIQSLQPKTEWEVEFIDGKLKLKQ